MDGRVIFGSVSGYSTDSGQYFVKYTGMTGDQTKGFPAQLISPTPFTDGGGMKAVPKVPVNTPCLLYNIGRYWVILGFLTPTGAVINDTHFETRPIAPGEQFTSHNSGSKHGFAANGSIMSWASNVMNMLLDPIAAQFTAFFKNMFVNWYAGFCSYIYDPDKKTSQFAIQIKKDVDLSSFTPGSIQKDRITMRMGALDDSHLMDIEAKQNFDTTNTSAYIADAKLGMQQDGTWLEIFSALNQKNTQALKLNTSGQLQYENKVNADNTTSVMLTIDPSQSKVVELKVNSDKAIVTIDSTGNVTIKTTDAAKIKLGGTGNEQQLVTKSFLDMVFANHMHPTASPGPPSPPIPIPSPVVADGPTNIYTFTTIGE